MCAGEKNCLQSSRSGVLVLFSLSGTRFKKINCFKYRLCSINTWTQNTLLRYHSKREKLCTAELYIYSSLPPAFMACYRVNFTFRLLKSEQSLKFNDKTLLPFFIDTHKCKYNLLVLVQGVKYTALLTSGLRPAWDFYHNFVYLIG